MVSNNKKTLICIGGPTASGKTSLAIELAQHFDTEIISADSRQIYKYFTIGTAKPSQAELALIKHHFIDEFEPEEKFNAGQFERNALKRLEVIFAQKDYAIVTGGTGLFFRALLEGLDEFPDVSAVVTNEITTIYETKGIETIQKELKNLDPVYYEQVDLNNPNRIIRALGVCKTAGIPYSSFLNATPKNRNFFPIKIAIQPDRQLLYEKIEFRVDQMIAQGLEQEVRNLLKYKETEAYNTVGYKEWVPYFNEEQDLQFTIDLIKRNSRRYAKRQFTWFNNQGNWHKIAKPDFNLALTIIEKALQ